MIPDRAGLAPKAKAKGSLGDGSLQKEWEHVMAIEVRIPTILRTYTDGAKQVEGDGSTLGELLIDLDRKHGGLRERLVDDGGLRRFVNVYLNDEDVRFLAGLDTPVKDGDTVTVLPAVAGGGI